MSIDRLKELQEDNNQKGLEMITESGRFAALSNRENNGLKPKAISSFNLFQTPENIAERMASMIPDFLPNAPTILEPSAGLGRLYKASKAKIGAGMYDLIDNSKDCTKELYNISGPGTRITEKDFLSVKPATGGNGSLIIKELTWAFYDVVIMNPPFKMGRDVKHILHGLKFLNSEGILIALCYNGVKQNKVLKPIANTWEVLPKNSFKSEGTAADVVLLTIKGSN